MANTVIQLKFSDVTSAPVSLNVGEAAYSNTSQKLFIGDTANNVLTIGGKFFTDQQGLIFTKTNVAFDTANSAASYANSAFASSNNNAGAATAGSYANSAFGVANSAASYANSGFAVSNSAASYANSAFLSANNSAGVNLTQNTNITNAGTYANSAFAAANTADAKGTSAGSYANSAFLTANTPSHVANSAASYANSAFAVANNGVGIDATQNTNITSAASYANSAFVSANSAGVYANSAFGVANSAFAEADSAASYANSAFAKANTDFTNISTTAADHGTASSVPAFRVEANGRISSANSTAIAIAASAITSGTLGVARGGTGAGTFTTNGVLLGQGTSAFTTASSSTEGHLLTINASGVPTFSHLQGGTF